MKTYPHPTKAAITAVTEAIHRIEKRLVYCFLILSRVLSSLLLFQSCRLALENKGELTLNLHFNYFLWKNKGELTLNLDFNYCLWKNKEKLTFYLHCNSPKRGEWRHLVTGGQASSTTAQTLTLPETNPTVLKPFLVILRKTPQFTLLYKDLLFLP